MYSPARMKWPQSRSVKAFSTSGRPMCLSICIFKHLRNLWDGLEPRDSEMLQPLERGVSGLLAGVSMHQVLFGCFKRNLKSDVKVAQLVGYVSEQAAYHHGETSLSETIVGMAQDFVGSNNINL